MPACRAPSAHLGQGDRLRDPGDARLPARRRPLGVRARGGHHHSGRVHPPQALSRRACRPRHGGEIRDLPAGAPGRAWRLAAVPGRRLRHERDRQDLFRAQDDRRRRRRPAHAARPRGGARARRRRQRQRVHPRAALALRRPHLEERAGDAGRDHAAAAVVSVPSRQGVVLGAHRHRAAPGAPGAQAGRQESARRSASTSCSSRTRATSARRSGRPTNTRAGSRSSAPRTSCCAPSSRGFRSACASAPSPAPSPS